jgi:hypothetical protein
MKLFEARQQPRQGDHVACATDINAHRHILRNSEIVNRGEMKNARCFLLDQPQIRCVQSKVRFRDVAFDKPKVTDTSSSERRNTIDLFVRARQQRRLHEQNEITLLPSETL